MNRALAISAFIIALLSLILHFVNTRSNTAMITLATKATLTALPTFAPQVIEVTRIVSITAVATAMVLPTPTPTSLITQSQPTGIVSPTMPAPGLAQMMPATLAPTNSMPLPTESLSIVTTSPVTDIAAKAIPVIFTCPTTSSNQYSTIPVEGPPTDHPDTLHGDLNLELRGYQSTTVPLELIDIGNVDANAPQFPGIFVDGRKPVFTTAYQVNDWNWKCGDHGCPDTALRDPEVTMLGMATTPGEAIRAPSREPEIYGENYTALILYAAESRITLVYAREDTVAAGYVVHLEKICVDHNLLALYRTANDAGRGELPALHNAETLGIAAGSEMVIAIRDHGKFLDPRSRGNWWHGY